MGGVWVFFKYSPLAHNTHLSRILDARELWAGAAHNCPQLPTFHVVDVSGFVWFILLT